MEMASDMGYACTSKDLYPSDAKEITKALYLLNYRKLPENSVVLSREEYERLKSLPNKIIKYMDRHLGDGELSGNILRNCAKQFGLEIKE